MTTVMSDVLAPGSVASRQKSCNACVRGKRRCDKRTPVCTRCAEKQISCIYHKRRNRESHATQQHAPNLDALLTGQPAGWPLGTEARAVDDAADFDFGDIGDAGEDFDMDMLTVGPLLADPSTNDTSLGDIWSMSSPDKETPQTMVNVSPEQEVISTMADYARMSGMCVSYAQLQYIAH